MEINKKQLLNALSFGLKIFYAVVSANLIIEYMFEGNIQKLLNLKFVFVALTSSMIAGFAFLKFRGNSLSK